MSESPGKFALKTLLDHPRELCSRLRIAQVQQQVALYEVNCSHTHTRHIRTRYLNKDISSIDSFD